MNNSILDDDLLTEKRPVIYASFAKRIGAALVDTGVLIPFILLSYYNMFSIKSYALAVFCTLISSLYQPLMEINYQATLGKMALKLKVLTEDFQRADVPTIIVRNSLYLILSVLSTTSLWFIYQKAEFAEVDNWAEMASFVANNNENSIEGFFSYLVFFSCLTVAYSRKRQALHDKMAKTVVVEILPENTTPVESEIAN